MAQIIVRNLDDGVKQRLRARAKRLGRSMEAEARDILTRAVATPKGPPVGLGTAIASRFAGIGFEEAEIEALRGEVRAADFER
jgi:antitoxin FitA